VVVVVVVVVVDVVDEVVGGGDGAMVVTFAGTPSGSLVLIWRPSAVMAPTTTRATSDRRIVYSNTDAPRSLTSRKVLSRA
jgi:hypothetical protein